MRLDRSNHLHPLVFAQHQAGGTTQARCCACDEAVSGETYSCHRCDIHLHRSCAGSTKSDNLFHRKHCLQLVENPPPDFEQRCSCKFCSNACDGFVCRCPSCNHTFGFKVSVGSVPDPDLQLSDHKHDNSISIDEVTCVKCRAQITKDAIRTICKECPFHLHSRCFELPRKISHPCHRKHPLVLTAPSLHPLGKRVCDVCENLCRGCVYSCRFCDFDLHINCVSPPPIAEGEIHEHSFSLLLRKCDFLCDGCGKKGNSAPYLCRKCNLVLHKNCVSLPRSVKIVRHDDLLFHAFSNPKNDPRTWNCQVCFKEVNPQHGSYGCSECDYVAHVDCATDRNVWDRSFGHPKKEHEQIKESSPSTSEPVSMSEPYAGDLEKHLGRIQKYQVIVKQHITDKEGTIIPTVIQHFSHDGDLMLCNEISGDEEFQCLGCLLPISSGSLFFACNDCDFLLHEACALSLRQEIKHWNHPHPLRLNWGSVFTCCYCKYKSTGFSYSCSECKTSICLHCRGIPEKFHHPGHPGQEHLLFFDHNYRDRCSACGNLCGRNLRNDHPFCAFTCNHCDFALDFPCLTLPTTTKHKYDEHPLTLAYHDKEEDPRRCVCNICEEKRDPKHWFYGCAKCEFKAHSKCVLGKYPFIWRGISVASDAHPHSLKAVTIYDYPLCMTCGEPIIDMALKCKESECNYMIHWECIYSVLKEKGLYNPEVPELTWVDTGEEEATTPTS